MQSWLKSILFTLLLSGCFYSLAFAQTTGKISGVILDAESGDPLPGANIIVRGTSWGAAADMQGEFYIINVSPGLYDIEARMMGYTPMVIENLRVAVNRTTPIEFKLTITVIEGQVVTVKAEKLILKKDQTSSIRNISSEDIELLPAENIATVVRMQPGVIGDNFRGGRKDEVSYLIDGISITDSYNNDTRTSNVNPEVVEDVEVITGTFNAEYGNAMSGVVNVITKDGSNNYHGNFSVNFGNYLTPHKDIFSGLSNSEFDRIQDYKASISGPVINDKLFFVANMRYKKDPGHLNAVRHFSVDDFSNFREQDPSLWHYEHTGDSSYVPFDWNEGLDAFGKLTYKPIGSIRISTSLAWNKDKEQRYSHDSRFNPDGHEKRYNETTMGTLTLNHMLTRQAFYEIKASYSNYWTGRYLYEDPLDSRYIHDRYRQTSGSIFHTGGQDKDHTNRWEKKLNVKADFTWQINKHHSIKTGIGFSRIELDQQFYTIRNAFEGSGIENIPELVIIGYDSDLNPIFGEIDFPNYSPFIFDNESIHTDKYVVKPIQGVYYIQDKMEFNMMVVNVGIRFDYFDPNTVYPSNYRNPGNQTDQDNPDRMSQYLDADPKYQISPRLGLSYSLGDKALLRFAYGHFLQLPPLNYFYQNSTFTLGTSDFDTRMGNAQLDPQKTIQYEIGLFQKLNDQMNFEVAVWYKDIYDLVTATVYTTYNNRRYGVYTNKEYGNARGLEIKYDYRYKAFSAGLNYTLSYTKGVADNARSTFDRAGDEQDPVNKLIPMSWDQRHTLNVNLGYNNTTFGTSVLAYYNSNQPYSWAPTPQSPLAAINLFPNNQYQPARFSVDLNAYYNLAEFNGIKVKLTLLVYNLLDRLNEKDVSGETGRAYSAIVQETDLTGYHSAFSTYEDVYQDPSAYSNPRQVKVGLGITF